MNHKKEMDESFYKVGAQGKNGASDVMNRATGLSCDIMRLIRNSLLINLRFLDAALIHFKPVASAQITQDMATDGEFLYFAPFHVIRVYKRSKEKLARNYLHTTLHCIFRHLFVGKRINVDLWDISCDIAVENIINGIDSDIFDAQMSESQQEIIKELNGELGEHLNAERLYRFFMKQESAKEDIEILRQKFYCDDHSLWYQDAENSDENQSSRKDDNQKDFEDDESAADTDSGDDVMKSSYDIDSDGADNNGAADDDVEQHPGSPKDELEKQWRDISERLQVDLETASNQWGDSVGGIVQELKSLNRERYDYSEFLSKFSVLGENMEVNDDEFDYIFYTYGMKLYEDMPLIEPLEYNEVKKIREFVIALDTSQSVAGDIVQKFVTKTYNMLKQSNNFFTKTNIHIIQCGSAISDDAVITSQDEFDEYIRTMKLKGFGGTDFRPVFEHVDMLIKNHELINLRGMIYFTDGFGTFPVSCPDYDTAFVFLDDGIEIPEVPAWAMKLTLTPEEMEGF